MVAKQNGQNSLWGTTGCDVYEVRPRKSGDGVDLISDRFRYGPIWYAGPDAVRNAVAYAKYRSLALEPGKDLRVGRLGRCNPDALIQRRFSPVAILCAAILLSKNFAKKSSGEFVSRGSNREIIADNLSKAGWSWGCVSALDLNGRTFFVADAHRDDGKHPSRICQHATCPRT
jgi:hypothetical protein